LTVIVIYVCGNEDKGRNVEKEKEIGLWKSPPGDFGNPLHS